MRVFRLLLARLRALVRRDVVAGEIREEMQFHLDMRADEYRNGGLSDDEARRAATRRFGSLGLMQDRGYDVRGGGVMETILQDVRYGVRRLLRERGFTVIAVLTLALAMGASTALFSVIDAALLRSVPYPDAEQIVSINVQVQSTDGQTHGLDPAPVDLERWRASSQVFTHLGRGRVGERKLVVDAGLPERLTVSRVSADFLEVFGTRPVIGRGIAVEDTRVGAPVVVLLGHEYWQSRLGGAPDAISRTIRVDGRVATVIGILPAGFRRTTAVWVPMLEPTARMREMRGDGTPTYGRLRAGLTLDQAAQELTAVSLAHEAGGQPAVAVVLESLYEDTVSRYRGTIRVVAGAVVLVLLIACLNVSGLLLARGASRQGELAVRVAIGAGRFRLVRQLLTESLVLAAAGGLGGVFIAWLLLDTLVLILPISLPADAAPAVDLRVLGFGAALSILTSVAFGLVPALRLSAESIGVRAAHAGRRHGSPLSRRGGQLLVGIEVALALVLLAGAGLMVRSLTRALSVDVGFDPRAFITMEVFPVESAETPRALYFAELLRAVRAIPGVAAAGTTSLVPLSGGGSYTSIYAGEQRLSASIKDVTPGYLEAIGLPPREGRLPADTDEGGATAVLSETAARRLFPDGSAVGREFTTGSKKTVWRVVGTIADIQSRGVLVTDERPDVYLMRRPSDTGSMAAFGRTPFVAVRSDGPIAGLPEQLRRAAHAVGPPVIVERIRSGSDWFAESVEDTRHYTVLLGLIGGLALTLTLVGIVGVTAYAAGRRTQEIGVRVAFGATPMDIAARLVSDSLWPVVAGLVAGIAGAHYATGVIETFLYDTTPQDPGTLAAVAAVMTTAALLAAWLPARRAARVDPVVALRAE